MCYTHACWDNLLAMPEHIQMIAWTGTPSPNACGMHCISIIYISLGTHKHSTHCPSFKAFCNVYSAWQIVHFQGSLFILPLPCTHPRSCSILSYSQNSCVLCAHPDHDEVHITCPPALPNAASKTALGPRWHAGLGPALAPAAGCSGTAAHGGPAAAGCAAPPRLHCRCWCCGGHHDGEGACGPLCNQTRSITRLSDSRWWVWNPGEQ